MVEISSEDRVEPLVGGRDLPLDELTLEHEGIGCTPERHRCGEDPRVLRGLARGPMRELHLSRGPLASRHQPDQAQPYRHGVFVVLARGLGRQVGEQVSRVRPPPLDGKRHGGRLVVHAQVAPDVLQASLDRGRVQHDVGQGAQILGVVVLAEVQAEAVVPSRPGGVVEDPGEVRTGDETVRTWRRSSDRDRARLRIWSGSPPAVSIASISPIAAAREMSGFVRTAPVPVPHAPSTRKCQGMSSNVKTRAFDAS